MLSFNRVRKVFGPICREQRRFFGISCALAGASAASIVWIAILRAPGLRHEPLAPSPQLAAQQYNSEQEQRHVPPGIPVDQVRWASASIPTSTLKGEIVTVAATGPAPRLLHERDDYRVAPPDILHVEVTIDGPKSLAKSIDGEFLVSPDGNIKLEGSLGSISVAGLTLNEIKAAAERQLAYQLLNPVVSVSVSAQNSHVYYVILENSESGDFAMRLPISTGDETVLDAIAQINGPKDLSKKNIWIARPQEGFGDGDKILPVDWQEITEGAATTNHRVSSGDRIFITEPPSFWNVARRILLDAHEAAENTFPIDAKQD